VKKAGNEGLKVEEKIKIGLWTGAKKCVTIYMNTSDNGAFALAGTKEVRSV
jgi:hypothetical protein